jgi:hypothetical protein
MRIKYVSSAEEHGVMSWISVYSDTVMAEMGINYYVEEYYDEILAKYNNNYRIMFASNGVNGVCAVHMQLFSTDTKPALSRIMFIGYVLIESSPYFNVFDLTEENSTAHYLHVNSNILADYFYSRNFPSFLVTIRRLDSSTQVYADIPFGDSTSQYI